MACSRPAPADEAVKPVGPIHESGSLSTEKTCITSPTTKHPHITLARDSTQKRGRRETRTVSHGPVPSETTSLAPQVSPQCTLQTFLSVDPRHKPERMETSGGMCLVQPRTDVRAHDKLYALDFCLHEHNPRMLRLRRVGVPAQRLDCIRLPKAASTQ